jgi:hypothetical protein
MPITVKCSCGREFTVESGVAGREALCPGCRKAVSVPQTSPPSPAPAAPVTAAPPAAPPAPPPSPASSAGGVEVFPNKIKFRCACGQKISVPLPAPSSAGTCPRCKRNLTVPKTPGQPSAAPPAKADAPIAVAPALPTPAAPAHCSKCGRRIESAGAAFCPRCGFPLALTMSPALRAAQPAPKPPRPQVMKLSAPPPAPAPAPASHELITGQPAGALRRLAAFAIDTTAAGAVGLARPVSWRC